MPTKNEMIFDVMNIAYGGEQSDDVKVSEEQVGYWINQIRADLIENKMKRGGELPESLIQCLECVEMEIHTMVDNCKVLRSKKELPATLGGNSANLITSVYSGEGVNCIFFSKTNYFRQRTSKFAKYTGKARRYFMKGNHLYILNDFTTEIISVAGIFENPEDAAKFCTSSGAPCYSNDDNYPVTLGMSQTITSRILKERFGIVREIEVDDQNNATQSPRNDNS